MYMCMSGKWLLWVGLRPTVILGGVAWRRGTKFECWERGRLDGGCEARVASVREGVLVGVRTQVGFG